MNILYQGGFLREGLQLLGHELFPLPESDASLPAAAAATGRKVDLAVLELYGGRPLPADLRDFEGRLVFYCIDSSLNMFWLSDICGLADDVFVDQKASVAQLGAQGIRAVWLPLCVGEGCFRKPLPDRRREVAFVGRTSPQRCKRANLLALLQRHAPVRVRQGVSVDVMQDVFAASAVVLNENLFDGLTLRVFQGLASGSPLLTEEGDGLRDCFADGEHLVCFTPGNLLERAADMLARPAFFAGMAAEGQRVCRERHTSRVRAAEFLTALERGDAANARADGDVRRLREARARCRHLLRFGGDVMEPVRLLNMAVTGGRTADVESVLLLGDMEIRRGRLRRAEQLYRSVCGTAGPFPFLRLALLRLREHDTAGASALTLAALREIPPERACACRPLPAMLANARHVADYLLVMGHIYRVMGHSLALGFAKSDGDPCPDTGLEFACRAWSLRPSAEAADLMLACSVPAGVGGELLPLLTEGIRRGVLHDRQILFTAGLAESYYAPDVAQTLRQALRASGRR